MLSRWLGTDLDFKKVQNMLTGQAIDDLTQGNYKTTIEDKLYILNAKSGGTEKSFFFEAANLLIKRQQVSQHQKNRELLVSYPNHRAYSDLMLPAELIIEATSAKKKTSINIEYNKVSINESITFPYSAPGDYERIYID
jgi:hypothetical protein